MGSQKAAPVPTTTTQIQKVELPAWVDAASQENYGLAKDIANKPYQPYTGDRVAGLSGGEQAAPGILQNGIEGSGAAFDSALAAATRAAGYSPQMVRGPSPVQNVQAGGFLSRDINSYMDPNVNAVVNTTLGGMRDNLARSVQANSDAARGAGAFGGSRHGVTEAVLRSQGAKDMASTEASLRSGAFMDAAGRIQQDNNSALQAALANQGAATTANAQRLQAGMANQSAGLQGAQLGLQGGQLAASTGQAISDTAGKNAVLSANIGATERGIRQAGLDTAYQNFTEARDYPTEMLNLRMQALGMSPYGKTTTGVSQSVTPNQNTSNPWLTGLGAAASIGSMFFSDPKVKKDIKKIGETENDLGVYKFKYKKSFMGREMPEQVGLMADEVERKIPDAVAKVKVGGKTVKVVDYGKAMSMPDLSRSPRSDKGFKRGFMGRAAA